MIKIEEIYRKFTLEKIAFSRDVQSPTVRIWTLR